MRGPKSHECFESMGLQAHHDRNDFLKYFLGQKLGVATSQACFFLKLDVGQNGILCNSPEPAILGQIR